MRADAATTTLLPLERSDATWCDIGQGGLYACRCGEFAQGDAGMVRRDRDHVCNARSGLVAAVQDDASDAWNEARSVELAHGAEDLSGAADQGEVGHGHRGGSLYAWGSVPQRCPVRCGV